MTDLRGNPIGTTYDAAGDPIVVPDTAPEPDTDAPGPARDPYEQARTEQIAHIKAAHATGTNGGYTAQPGDTFATIALAIYGDAEAAGFLYEANAGIVGSDPAALAPGTPLVIPVG
jgi:nucleoid-associated protein YgaU